MQARGMAGGLSGDLAASIIEGTAKVGSTSEPTGDSTGSIREQVPSATSRADGLPNAFVNVSRAIGAGASRVRNPAGPRWFRTAFGSPAPVPEHPPARPGSRSRGPPPSPLGTRRGCWGVVLSSSDNRLADRVLGHRLRAGPGPPAGTGSETDWVPTTERAVEYSRPRTGHVPVRGPDRDPGRGRSGHRHAAFRVLPAPVSSTGGSSAAAVLCCSSRPSRSTGCAWKGHRGEGPHIATDLDDIGAEAFLESRSLSRVLGRPPGGADEDADYLSGSRIPH